MGKAHNRIEYQEGQMIGNMWFIRDIENTSPRRAIFKCKCGNAKEIDLSSVKSLKSNSCGCVNKIKNTNFFSKHSESRGQKTPEYRSWKSFRNRCYNKNNDAYMNYGGRGITVCDRWLDKEKGFNNFLEDMGRKPSPKHSIDRIDNDGNYCPENCRWATKQEQSVNRRSNINITYNNKTQTMVEWTRELNLSYTLISGRIRLGWSVQDAFFSKKRINKYS